jgi:hypothetical protein
MNTHTADSHHRPKYRPDGTSAHPLRAAMWALLVVVLLGMLVGAGVGRLLVAVVGRMLGLVDGS